MTTAVSSSDTFDVPEQRAVFAVTWNGLVLSLGMDRIGWINRVVFGYSRDRGRIFGALAVLPASAPGLGRVFHGMYLRHDKVSLNA